MWEIVCFGPFPGLHDDPSAGVQGEARPELRGRAQEGVQKGFFKKTTNYLAHKKQSIFFSGAPREVHYIRERCQEGLLPGGDEDGLQDGAEAAVPGPKKFKIQI